MELKKKKKEDVGIHLESALINGIKGHLNSEAYR